jgi:hypothetical protein
MSQPPVFPIPALPDPPRPKPLISRPPRPGGLGHLPGELEPGGTLDPDPPQPPVDPNLITVTVFGMVAPSAQVRRIGHGSLVNGRFVAARPDLDAVLDAPTRSWPVRVVITWPVGSSQTVEVIDVAAVGPNTQTGPSAPHWGLELAGASAAPLPGPSGPGVPASIFCVLWPWASFCH